MDPEQISRWKEEYYETLAENEPLHELLNQDGGLMLARVGSHPPWPARFSEPGEFAKMSRYRLKKGQLCVYFFGTRNYGWVYRTAISPFSEDYSALKASKKFSPTMIQRAIDSLAEARVILDDVDAHHRRFFDRIMERREEPVDMPCEVCHRVDDHFSMLILCDGKGCKREFHMNCLRPPLESVPPGDWYCPECAKDPSRQLDAWTASGQEQGDAHNHSHATLEAHSTNGGGTHGSASSSSAAAGASVGSAEKLKKDKLKPKDTQTLKRKLPTGSTKMRPQDGEISSANAKKHKAQKPFKTEPMASSSLSSSSSTMAPPALSPPKSAGGNASSRPSTPVLATTKKAMELSMLMNAEDDDTDDNDRHSEERCLICGYGGELVVCEFYGCTKVYHQFCLGSFPFPKDEDATWYCPRHICAISGEKEYVDESDGAFAKSPRKISIKRQLWKCANCPLAVADSVMPVIPKSYVLSRSNRKFTCMHCSAAAPVKVALATKIERIWSMIATNNQSVAFCGPLLPGVELPKTRKEPCKMFLFRVLAKIRRLEYDDSAAFARDIDIVVREALDVIQDRSVPLAEAARTMKTICEEQMHIHRVKLDALDSKISGLKALSKSKKALEEAFVTLANGDKKRWPLKWRQECGPFEDRYYPRVEPRSLPEWTAFVTSAGLYVSYDDAQEEEEDGDGGICGGSDHESASSGAFKRSGEKRKLQARKDESWSDNESFGGDERTRSSREPPPSFPGLTLSEGTDIMLALAELSRSSHANASSATGRAAGADLNRLGAWPEGELEELERRDFFLSPSISEMQQMFDQQSAVLRRALESHSALQKAWLVSKQKMLGLGGGGAGFSVGEGRLAAELRLSNQNLRARLRNKDKLVDELTDERVKLQSEVEALHTELAQAKARAISMERAARTASGEEEDTAVSCSDDGSTGSGETDRKSPRNPAKSAGSKAAAKAKATPKPPKKPTERTK